LRRETERDTEAMLISTIMIITTTIISTIVNPRESFFINPFSIFLVSII